MKIAKNGYAVLLSLLLAACGGGGGTPAGSSTVNLSGTAAKGLLAGATVQAYEVVNGELRAFGQPTLTDEQGAYSLNLPPTDNPVIVKVTATAQTTMLDETGQLVDGKFPKVPAPVGLELRTMVDSLTQTRQVHANTFTEMAIKTASSFKDAQGNLLPVSRGTLIDAESVITETLTGTNPFTVKALAGVSNTATADEKKLTALLTGVLKNSKELAAGCVNDSTGLTCNVPAGYTLTLSPDGTTAIFSNASDVITKLQNIEQAIKRVDNDFTRQLLHTGNTLQLNVGTSTSGSLSAGGNISLTSSSSGTSLIANSVATGTISLTGASSKSGGHITLASTNSPIAGTLTPSATIPIPPPVISVFSGTLICHNASTGTSGPCP